MKSNCGFFFTFVLCLSVGAGPLSPARAQEGAPAGVQAPAQEVEAAEGTEEEKKDAGEKRKPHLTEEFLDEDISELELETEQKKTPLRKQAIQQSLDLLDRTPNYPQAASLYARVAEYMTQNIEFQFKSELLKYKKDLQRFKDGEISTAPTLPKQDYSETLPHYKKILTQYPDYEKVEEIYFYLGRNGLETAKSLGDDKLALEAISYLDKFVEKFPQSPYRPKALIMIAEYHYNMGNLAEALNHYKMLIEQHPDAPMYDYAQYKLAWVYYNYQQYDEVIALLKTIIERFVTEGKQGVTLFTMVLDDFTETIAEAGNGWTEARDFLVAQVGEEEAYKRLHRIAKQMVVHDFSEDSITLVKHFISLNPNAPGVIDYWDQNLTTARFALGYEETDEMLQEMTNFFAPEAPFLTANSSSEIRDKVEDLRLKWALYTAEHYLEEAMYQGQGGEYYQHGIKRFNEILAQGAGSREEQALAGLVLSYAGILKDQTSDLIWVAENVLGVSVPDDYRLPKKRSERAYNENEAALMSAGAKYLAMTNRKGLKPDLQPMRAVDMQAAVHHLLFLFQYTAGHWSEALSTVDSLLSYKAKSVFLSHEVWMIADASARISDWAGLENRMKTMLDAGNTKIAPPAEVMEHMCTGGINLGLSMAEGGRTADAMGKLAGLATACQDTPKKAAEAWYQLGKVAEDTGDVARAREAYTKVSEEFSSSGFARMARSGLKRLR